MRVVVKLFGMFIDKRSKVRELDVPNGTRVLELLDILEIRSQEVTITCVNGTVARSNHLLQDNDCVSFLPPLGGG